MIALIILGLLCFAVSFRICSILVESAIKIWRGLHCIRRLLLLIMPFTVLILPVSEGPSALQCLPFSFFIIFGLGSVVEVFNIWLLGGESVFGRYCEWGLFHCFIIVEKKVIRARVVFFMRCSSADRVFSSGSHPVDSLKPLAQDHTPSAHRDI